MTFKPLLAAKADLESLRFPLLASPKMDGIRAMTGVKEGICSRNLKEIPNHHIRNVASAFPEFLDGEILTYTDGVRDDFNTVQSKVMSADGEPDFVFHVFDDFHPDRRNSAFYERMSFAEIAVSRTIHPSLAFVQHTVVETADELLAVERTWVECDGWEGVMLRDPGGRYKLGRSTAKEQILLKVKRFDDDEAVVVGFVERMHNANEARRNELGHIERSSSKSNLVPTGTLGALVCEWNGLRFEIGTGFTETERERFWEDRQSVVGRTVTFKFQGVGSQGAPRFPVFLGFRADLLV